MMRLFYISIILCSSLTLVGQSIQNFDEGRIDAPLTIEAQGEDLYGISVDASNFYRLDRWNGYEWKELERVLEFPKHGTNPLGEFIFRDMTFYKGELYLCGVYEIRTSGVKDNRVVKWDGSSWMNISSADINESKDLFEFAIVNDELLLCGDFGSSFNILQFKDKTWSKLGGVLLKDQLKDFALDFNVHDDRLYAHGKFSAAGIEGQYHFAEFVDDEWKAVSTPPFVKASYASTTVNGLLAVVGDAGTSSQLVKIKTKSGWESRSNGLDQFSINSVDGFEGGNEQMVLIGDFVRKTDQKAGSLLYYDGKVWSLSSIQPTGAHSVTSTNDNLFLFGELELEEAKFVARYDAAYAMLTGLIYLDGNDNCDYDEGETPATFELLELNPGKHKFVTDRAGRFSIPVEVGNYSISWISNPSYQLNSSCSPVLNVTVDQSKNYQIDPIALSEKSDILDIHVEMRSSNGWTISSKKQTKLQLCVENRGNIEFKGGSLYWVLPDWWESTTFSPNYSSSNADTLFWDLNALEAGSEVCILFESGMPKNEMTGDKESIHFGMNSEHLKQDIRSDNNSASLQFEMSGNDLPLFKQSDHDMVHTSDEKLSYHIMYQNTGNKPVERLRIRDTLDNDLYITRVDEYSSHSSSMNRSYMLLPNGNYQWIFEWIFEDLNLPDTATDSEKSKAWVQFDLGLANGFLEKGMEICNQARVMVDNNEPNRTNKVCLDVDNLGLGPNLKDDKLTIYPNPTHSILTIENQDLDGLDLDLFDAMGKRVESVHVQGRSTLEMDVSGLSSGIYFLKGSNISTKRLFVR